MVIIKRQSSTAGLLATSRTTGTLVMGLVLLTFFLTFAILHWQHDTIQRNSHRHGFFMLSKVFRRDSHCSLSFPGSLARKLSEGGMFPIRSSRLLALPVAFEPLSRQLAWQPLVSSIPRQSQPGVPGEPCSDPCHCGKAYAKPGRNRRRTGKFLSIAVYDGSRCRLPQRQER